MALTHDVPSYIKGLTKMAEHAIIKFNNGHGAVLCNQCQIILKQGTDHADCLHFCNDACVSKYASNSKPIDARERLMYGTEHLP